MNKFWMKWIIGSVIISAILSPIIYLFISNYFYKYGKLFLDDNYMEEIIIQCSKTFALSPKYMVAHFECENKEFDRKAKGDDGELGLGQMLPTTAIIEAKRWGYTNLAEAIKQDPTVLYDIQTSIFLSCAHYRTILNMNDVDDIIDAMAAYNKGKNRWFMKNNYPIRLKTNYERRYGNIDINKIFKKMK